MVAQRGGALLGAAALVLSAAAAHRARFASPHTLLFGPTEFSLFVAAPRKEAELLLGGCYVVLERVIMLVLVGAPDVDGYCVVVS